MKLTSPVAALAGNALRHIPQRLGNALVIVVGIAGAVAVLIPVLALYLGFRATLTGDGRADRAIVLSRAETTEYNSSLSRESVAVITDAPGVRHDARGEPMVSAEVVLAAPVARKRDHSDVNVTLRGVGPHYFEMRPELKLIAGRMYRPGTQELLVGAAARSQFDGLGIGEHVRLQDGDWTVVGEFAGGSGARQSELVADAQTVMSAYKLDTFNSVTATLESAGAFPKFATALSRDGRLFVAARREPQYLAQASASVNSMLRLVAYAIGSIMSLGAVFAALNATYSAIIARTVEIATLRAIGFAASSVALAVLIETLLLSVVGAAVGASLSYTAFGGATISTLGGALFDSQLVYSLAVTPRLIGSIILLACGLGLVGGLVPAIRAARTNIAVALHEN
ncbi:MAG TPA: FtsX-like permease family protein [Steroidobacteraceae bacterium]|nr:FtsX-like permease family protein [Steroidobacteraceae bacterium]